MSKRFVITDIHGCFLSFKKLWEDQLKPDAGDMVYFLVGTFYGGRFCIAP